MMPPPQLADRRRWQQESICAIALRAVDVFGVPLTDLFARGRRQPVCDARHAIWLLAREKLGTSLTQLGEVFDRHHTTIWLGLRSGRALLETSREYRERCAKLRCNAPHELPPTKTL